MTEHRHAHPKVTQVPHLLRGVERQIASLRNQDRNGEADEMQATLDKARDNATRRVAG